MILNILVSDPGSGSGWLVLEDPDNGLRLGSTTLSKSSSEVKRVEADNPYVPGSYTVRSVAGNTSEVIEIQVIEPSGERRDAKVDYLNTLFTRASFKIRVIYDEPGNAVEMTAQAAQSMTTDNRQEFMHYGLTLVTFQFEALPVRYRVTHTAVATPYGEHPWDGALTGSTVVPEHDHPHEHAMYLKDAPIDDVAYNRRNGLWTPAATGGGSDGIPEPPNDAEAYLRQFGSWLLATDLFTTSQDLSDILAGYAPLLHTHDYAPTSHTHTELQYGDHLVTWDGANWRYRGATVVARPSVAAYDDGGRVIWDSSLDATVTTQPVLAITGDLWYPHESVSL